METIYYFLPLIVALGIITSYEDLKYEKIRNKWITHSILISLIINILIIIYLKDAINKTYYINFLINSLISLVIAFLFFYFDIWSEGDGKLFFAFTIILPLSAYSNWYLPYFPSFVLLLNVFIPYLIYSIFLFLLNPDKEILKKSIKEVFVKKLMKSFLMLFSISWMISILLNSINITSVFLIYASSFFAYFGFEKFQAIINFKNKNEIIYILLSFFCILRMFIDKNILSINFWISFLIMFFMYRLLFSGVSKALIYKTGISYLKKEEIKPGMVLVFPIIRKDNGFFLNKSNIEDEKTNINYIIDNKRKLEENDIVKILKSKINFKIPIYKKIPFAHLLFLGVIFTIIAKGNILIYLVNIFN